MVEAKRAGSRGVNSYPAGVTTNSSFGVVDYAFFFLVFAEMERQDMILNLHGESPSGGNVTVPNAEESFLTTFLGLHSRFPKLRTVLEKERERGGEHCTTAAAIQAVLSCGPSVAATITAHHLFLTVDDWAGDAFSYCKPVAKTPQDREALLKAAASAGPKFFLEDCQHASSGCREEGRGRWQGEACGRRVHSALCHAACIGGLRGGSRVRHPGSGSTDTTAARWIPWRTRKGFLWRAK